MTLDPGTLSPLSHSGCPLTVALGCPITSGVHTDSHTLELNESLSHTYAYKHVLYLLGGKCSGELERID